MHYLNYDAGLGGGELLALVVFHHTVVVDARFGDGLRVAVGDVAGTRLVLRCLVARLHPLAGAWQLALHDDAVQHVAVGVGPREFIRAGALREGALEGRRSLVHHLGYVLIGLVVAEARLHLSVVFAQGRQFAALVDVRLRLAVPVGIAFDARVVVKQLQ